MVTLAQTVEGVSVLIKHYISLLQKPLIPMFQNQSGLPYSHFMEVYVLYGPSGVTPADLSVTSMAARPFSSTYLRASLVGLITG